MQDNPVSKTQRKRAMLELQALGAALVALPAARLESLALPQALARAVLEAKRITAHGGRRRQMQYIGRLMREVDAEPIRAALDAINGKSREATARQHALERWRERLLADDAALTEFANAHPGNDLQALRTLIRNARREQKDGKPLHAYRELFRIVRESVGRAAPSAAS